MIKKKLSFKWRKVEEEGELEEFNGETFYIGTILVDLLPPTTQLINCGRLFLKAHRVGVDSNTWISDQDKAPMHIAPTVKEFLSNKRITVREVPPLPTDLALYDFYLFLKVKNALIRTHFQSVEDVKAKAMTS
ncbi:hypothetical protein TNCV_1001401 [Trichonephila clavipes]|nr:hypothetical protein TNCV_1001401 [Trichonephila clavipes]